MYLPEEIQESYEAKKGAFQPSVSHNVGFFFVASELVDYQLPNISIKMPTKGYFKNTLLIHHEFRDTWNSVSFLDCTEKNNTEMRTDIMIPPKKHIVPLTLFLLAKK